jgi:hypothetical protein
VEPTHVIVNVAAASDKWDLMKTAKLNTDRTLLRMLTGDPTEAMESAKKLIGSKVPPEPALLEQIASERRYKRWSRIAAVYTLGFLSSKPSVDTLMSILRDGSDDPRVRAHAAEALGNIRDKRAIAALREALLGNEAASIKRWCIYALSEIGAERARPILEELAATRPTGAVARELRMALGDSMQRKG